MARIRTLKPEIWTDEKFGPLDPLTKLVFIGLISQADDGGRLLDSVRLIDGLLFPYDDSTSVRRSLDELSRTGLIERGVTASDQRVLQIANWDAHQKIDRPNLDAALPHISVPDSELRDPRRNVDERSSKDRRSLDEDSSARSTTNDQRPTTNDPSLSTREDDETFGDLGDVAIASIKGLYGWPPEDREGTDERVWGDTPAEARPNCIRIAVQRLEGEGNSYQGKLFRRILGDVISEQGQAPNAQEGEVGFIAYDADYEPGGLYYTGGADG